MDDPVELRIEIVGATGDDILALREWLRSEPGLREAVMSTPGSESGASTLLVELNSRSAIPAFTATINAYLRTNRDVGVEISTVSRSMRLWGRIEHSAIEFLTSEPVTMTYDGGNTTVAHSHDFKRIQFHNTNAYMPGDESHQKWLGPSAGSSHPPASGQTEHTAHPVTIYLSDEGAHEQAEAAVEELLASAGLHIEDREDPVLGSWFRRMWATVKGKVRSPAGREATMMAAHAAETRLVLAPDADVTAKLLQGVGPVIQSLEPTKDAVIRVGNVLIVKVDWVVTVSQLTPAQQFLLNHNPDLARSPQQILAALKAEDGDQPPALQ